MANITITVQSLINASVYDSYTIDNGQTVNQLKTAVNAARGFDSTWYDIVQNGSVVSGTATLSSLGITSGTALRTHNKIGRLATRQLRQEAKLALASLDRIASGETRPYYDLTQLPTYYVDNTVTDNANSGGLVIGRPWIAISYSISPSASSVNEGDTITYTITTVGVADGTTLYWTNSGTTTGVDFTGNANSGSFTITSGSATVTRPLKNDVLTEGDETVVLQVRTGSTSGTVVATSGAVTVADTSIPVVDQYGFFEQQLIGGTYLSFDQTISGQSVTFVCTNFDGNPTHGSYIKVNGTLVAGDQQGLAPDGVNTNLAPFQMTRGHTIIVLNPTNGAIRSGFPKCYDTYGNAGLGTSIATDIKNAATNDIILIGTYDATSVNQNFRDALTNYCGDTTYTNTWAASRRSQMFLGKRNATP